MIEKITLTFAMCAEADPIAERLGLGPTRVLRKGLPALIRNGRCGAVNITLSVQGVDPVHGVDRIGTESAALTAWVLAEEHEPDLLINAGTCGGFEARGGSVGKTYLASGHFLYHDHVIPIPGFRELGEGRIPVAPYPAVKRLLEIESGPVSSGASLTTNDHERAFFDREEVIAKDMEATAIASVARDLDLPFMALKTVTDLVDHPEPSQDAFQRNLASSTGQLTDHLESLLRFLAEGRSLSELGR
jgi:5'-methylthioadenosine nucleosidase